ncbi:MAG: nucleoside deaminase [Clostridia bacterium]|nr:nucleoside deaminase [Clostridia bacterium]
MNPDELWMRAALDEAKKAYLENEVPVGAVIVKNSRLIAAAHNRCRAENDETLHAEMLAMKQAKAALGSLSDCILFVTLEPCAMCAGAAIHYRLPKLVFGAFDERCGCCGSRIDLTDHWFYHSVETYGGILETECTDLLKNFFKEKR